MQRRRLSPLARLFFECAWPLAEAHPPMPVVFASRHGETPRSFALLSDLAAQQPLSPTAFGLSVHNAIIGQWSILRQEQCEGIALAGEHDMLEHAFLEAACLLHNGADKVLVVLAEEQPPAGYAPWIDDVPFAYAAAFRVSRRPHWQLTQSHDSPAPDAGPSPIPPALELIRQLLLDTPHWHHQCAPRSWIWQRLPS